MLPPVQALSRSATSYQDSANDAAPSGTAAAATTSDAMVRVDREGGSAIAGRINNLLLSGRESMQTNLADIADLVGGAIGLTRKDGESDAAFAQRFANALGTLDDSQRMRLQTQLNQALKGLQVDILLRVLQNTDGPEAALLSAYMEIQRNNSGDLRARTVVSSYSQNGAGPSQAPSAPPSRTIPAPVAGQMANLRATQLTAATIAEEASVQTQRAAMPAAVDAEASPPAGRSPQVASGVAQSIQRAAAYPTESGGTARETEAGALAGETIETPVEAQGQATVRQRLADAPQAAARTAATIGRTETTQTHESLGGAAGTNTAAPLKQADGSTMGSADVGQVDQARGEVDLSGKLPTESDATGNVAGARQTVTGQASRTAMADNIQQRAELSPSLAATQPDQPTQSMTMRTASRAYEVIAGMASGQEEPTTRSEGRPEGGDDALDRLSTSVLALKGWMEVAVAGSHALTKADKDEESDLLRQMFFQATEEPEHAGEDLLDRSNTDQTSRPGMLGTTEATRQQMSDALPDGQAKADPAAANQPSKEASQAGRTAASEAEAELTTVQQEKMAREPAVLSLTGAQAVAHAIPVQVPQFVPLPIVSYLAMQDEADAAKTETLDAVEALNDDDPHQDTGGQKQERGEDDPQEDAENDGEAASADLRSEAAISDDAALETEQDGWQEPASAPSASIRALPAPTEDGFQAESLYWRIADLA